MQSDRVVKPDLLKDVSKVNEAVYIHSTISNHKYE